MTKTKANPQVAEIGRDPVTRPGRLDGLRNNLRNGLAGLMGRISTKARWILSAAVGLIAPAVLIAAGAATPLAQAIACVGNGSFMALAASANAFTLIP